MAPLKSALWLGTTLLALGQQQSFVSAQGLERLANGFIVEFVDIPNDNNRVSTNKPLTCRLLSTQTIGG